MKKVNFLIVSTLVLSSSIFAATNNSEACKKNNKCNDTKQKCENKTADCLDKQIAEKMTQCDYEAACKLYFEKLKANKNDAKAKSYYNILKRVVRYEKMYTKSTNNKQKQKLAAALRNFYYSANNLSGAEKLDKESYSNFKTEANAYRLAATQLNLKQYSESIKTLDSIAPKKMTQNFDILKAYNYQKLNKAKESTKFLAMVKVNDLKNPSLLLIGSRIYALQNNKEKACELLTKSFELTYPPKLKMVKEYVANSDEDFKSMRQDTAFLKALKTKSKVKVSSCSGGSDCGSCKLKNSCNK